VEECESCGDGEYIRSDFVSGDEPSYGYIEGCESHPHEAMTDEAFDAWCKEHLD
jgi:hypothetical protein